jgi:hypothetical protein
MRKWIWAVLVTVPLAFAGGFGLAYAHLQQTNASGFICPITGEELPCSKCCPLNDNQ